MSNKAGCGSVGIAGTLTIVFTVLKLCGLIAWQWTWVLSPLWITAFIDALLVMIALMAYGWRK